MAEARSSNSLLSAVQREVDRSVLRARNGIKHAARINRAKVGLSPKDVVWERDKAQLWRYHNPRVTRRPPLLIVMSLISRSYILDLRPGNSFVEHLLKAGYDVFLLDWGVPDESDSQNTIETYVDDYLPLAVAAVFEEAGTDSVTLIGYCLGGVLATLYVGGHPEAPVRNLVVVASPVDYTKLGVIAGLVRQGGMDPAKVLDPTGNVPADAIRNVFRLRKPTADWVQYANLWENLWNDQYLEGYQAMNQWNNDHVPFPGAAMEQMVKVLIRENRLMKGSLRLGGRKVALKDITVPVLNVIAEKDDIVPLASAEPFPELVGSKDAENLTLAAGHVGLLAGRKAAKETLPSIVEWLDRHSDRLRRPGAIP
jgi:poly[(R)-3-hydroxyalkanoate] polymerase subunit PhaC